MTGETIMRREIGEQPTLLARTLVELAAPARSAISDGPVERTAIDATADAHVHLDSGLPEPLTPIGFAAAGQLVALHLALAEGRSPDVPRALVKVTVTR